MELAYSLETFDKSIEQAYRELLPHQTAQIDAGLLRWKFVDNPAGTGLVSVCREASGRVLGLNAFQRTRFVGPAGIELIGHQSMDTFVDPAARGLGVFNNLLQTFYENQQDDLIYGFPNAASSKGFFGRQKWSFLGSAPFLIRPIRAGYFLKKLSSILPDFRIPRLPRSSNQSEPIRFFDEGFGDLSAQMVRPGSYMLRRDSTYLNWRLFDKPLACAHVLARGHDAFVAARIDNKHGGRIGYILEAAGDPSVLKGVLEDMNAYLADNGADAVLAWAMPHMPSYSVYRHTGYLPLPRKLRPIEINFGARALSMRTKAIDNPANWYLSYLDSDTV